MEKTLRYAIEKDENEEEYKKGQEMMEKLGFFSRTKLEKLADSFSNVKYKIHRDEKNSDTGFIDFAYTGQYFFKKKESEIKKVAESFYNKDDYTILVATSEDGFTIIVWDSFFKNFKKKSS